MKNPNQTLEENKKEEAIKAAIIIGGVLLLILGAWLLMNRKQTATDLTEVISQLHSL